MADRKKVATLIRQATALDFPYPFRPETKGRDAAVLLLLSWSQSPLDLEILITRRTEHVDTHKGQYAFPGGMKDLEDSDLGITALRETEEEVGIPRSQIELMGELPKIWTPSGFLIHPWVGLSNESSAALEIVKSADEIDFHFWVKVSELTRAGVYTQEFRDFLGKRVPMDVFQVGEHRIWGATAAILKNFIGRLDQVGLK